jgi:hypothetical protein
MKEVTVIRIEGLGFLGPDYHGGPQLPAGNALASIVQTPAEARAWVHPWIARKCAHLLATREFAGRRVYVEKYAIWGTGKVEKKGEVAP